VSAVSPEREQLEAALEYIREGDVLVVTKLDRLARSVPHLCEIGKRLDAKGVGLKVLDQAIDTTTPTGRLMFNVLGAIAQFERELIRERMLVGIAKAKAEGKYKGRAPTARVKADKVKQLRAPQRSRANLNQPHLGVQDTDRLGLRVSFLPPTPARPDIDARRDINAGSYVGAGSYITATGNASTPSVGTANPTRAPRASTGTCTTDRLH
jgi:hypothetical protein